MITFWSVFILIHVGLAMPPAFRCRSWKRFFVALILSFVGIVLPIFIFSASAFLIPEWKGGCRHGWLDCFHVGKLALLPLVLWASASLYAVEIYQTQERTRPWIVLGFVTGAVVSTVCLGIGMIIHGAPWHDRSGWLLVPAYVAVWYVIRTRQLLKAAGTTIWLPLTSLLGSAPFWIASVILSRQKYLSLPDTAPRCFIATAAMRGHNVLVGPRLRIIHHGEDREANQQLLTLWRLEDFWMTRAPRSHRRFRCFYNFIGPVVASRVTSPFIADAAYLAIKPVEIVARSILKQKESKEANQRMEHYGA